LRGRGKIAVSCRPQPLEKIGQVGIWCDRENKRCRGVYSGVMFNVEGKQCWPVSKNGSAKIGIFVRRRGRRGQGGEELGKAVASIGTERTAGSKRTGEVGV
ncbi:unnamed protein product, partial [Scytosiphon promiscuus]